VQAGVPVVQANMGAVQSWDTHWGMFPRLKERLLPPLDRGAAARLDDREAAGLLAETLVVLLGELGRAPRTSAVPGRASPGREPWSRCFCGVFAGAGVCGGQAVGRPDKTGAYPSTAAYGPGDVGATAYPVLGVGPAAEVRDRQGRPAPLNRGQLRRAPPTGWPPGECQPSRPENRLQARARRPAGC
jgi:hypothetical protein